MNKRKTIAILVSLIVIMSTSISAFASSTPNSRENEIAGKIVSDRTIAIQDEDTGDTALIDSQDFYTLADEISKESDTRKQEDLNLEQGLNNCFTSVANGKQMLASALATKGKSINNDASFEEIADVINSIEVNMNPANIQGIVTIKAHFCNTTDEHIIEFTDNETASAFEQYQEYVKQHPEREGNGGCWLKHTHTESCYHKEECGSYYWYSQGGYYNGSTDYIDYVGYSCRCGANKADHENQAAGVAGQYAGTCHNQIKVLDCKKNFEKTCGCYNGQILTISIDY